MEELRDRGVLIAIEGTDGSGKQTQTKLLVDKLQRLGKQVFQTSFPNYESQSSALVKMYLAGEIAENAEQVSAKASSMFYATDRYISYKRYIEAEYNKVRNILVFDRYTGSNIIHQGAKIIQKTIDNKKQALSEFIEWVDNLEHNDLEMPRADTTIFLHVPIEYTKKLMEERVNKITGESKKDIHESNTTHLENSTFAGLMAAKQLGWSVVECVKDGKLRTIEDIHLEIFELVSRKIQIN